jgi:hypothetical protein
MVDMGLGATKIYGMDSCRPIDSQPNENCVVTVHERTISRQAEAGGAGDSNWRNRP